MSTAGPAWEMATPVPRKKPAPIALPKAIMDRWLFFRLPRGAFAGVVT